MELHILRNFVYVKLEVKVKTDVFYEDIFVILCI